MPNIDYEKFLFWDAILFPGALAIVLSLFAVAAYYDMTRRKSGDPRKPWDLSAFVVYMLTSILVVVRLTLDLWVIASAMEGARLGTCVLTLVSVFGYAFNVALLLTFVVTVGCFWVRLQVHWEHNTARSKKSSD